MVGFNMTNYEQIVKMWREYPITSVAALDTYLHSFRVLFAYNSGKIENPDVTYDTTREVFSDGKVNGFSGSVTTVVEIHNQKLCYDFLLPKIIAKAPLTLALIKEVHEITTNGTYDARRFFELGERPGTFKRHDFVVGENEVGAAPEDVVEELTSLLDELENTSGGIDNPEKILKLAAYFHVWFETIHPFADGNGRVGRTLMNYLLMIHGHPPLIVHNDNKSQYYAALEKFRSDEDLDALFLFFKGQLERTWAKSLERHLKR